MDNRLPVCRPSRRGLPVRLIDARTGDEIQVGVRHQFISSLTDADTGACLERLDESYTVTAIDAGLFSAHLWVDSAEHGAFEADLPVRYLHPAAPFQRAIIISMSDAAELGFCRRPQ